MGQRAAQPEAGVGRPGSAPSSTFLVVRSGHPRPHLICKIGYHPPPTSAGRLADHRGMCLELFYVPKDLSSQVNAGSKREPLPCHSHAPPHSGPCPHTAAPARARDSVGLVGPGASTQSGSHSRFETHIRLEHKGDGSCALPGDSPRTSQAPSAASKGARKQPAAPPEATSPRTQSSQAPDCYSLGGSQGRNQGKGWLQLSAFPPPPALGPTGQAGAGHAGSR